MFFVQRTEINPQQNKTQVIPEADLGALSHPE